MSHTAVIITIILSAGLLGGLTNFLSINEFKDRKESWINFFKALTLGLCASTTVPLFLQIISNNLLDAATSTEYPIKNYFILTGFCVLAAFFSKRFLDDLYEKVNQAQKEAKEAKKSAKEAEKFVVSKLEEEQEESEVSDDNSVHDTSEMLPTFTPSDNVLLDNDYVRVLDNFQRSKFRDRSVAGLVKGTKVNEDKISLILRSFVQEGLLDIVRWYGKDFYRLNNKGRRVKLFDY